MNSYLVTYKVGDELTNWEVKAPSAQAAATMLHNASKYFKVVAVHLLVDMAGEWV